MKIIYVCKWDKIKENTWSGSTYFLNKALGEIVDIQDYDLSLNRMLNYLVKINKLRIRECKLYKNCINSNLEDLIMKYKIKRCECKKNDIILQIGGVDIPKGTNGYAYQDLSVDSLIFYKNEKPKLFQYSGYQNNSVKDLRIRREKQMRYYEKLNGIFTMSKWLEKNLVEYSGIPKEKVHYVGAGANVDPSKIKKLEKNNNRILFVGRDFKRKGGDLTYKAYKLLKRRRPNVELYIIGPKYLDIQDDDDNLHILGDLTYEELVYYFNLCDIFCLPSRFEAFGLVFIEALIYGLPCIGRNEFEMKEFIKDGENGYLVNDDDYEVLAEKMELLLDNTVIKNNVISNRQRYMEEYSWKNVARRMKDIIEKDISDIGCDVSARN